MLGSLLVLPEVFAGAGVIAGISDGVWLAFAGFGFGETARPTIGADSGLNVGFLFGGTFCADTLHFQPVGGVVGFDFTTTADDKGQLRRGVVLLHSGNGIRNVICRCPCSFDLGQESGLNEDDGVIAVIPAVCGKGGHRESVGSAWFLVLGYRTC